MAKTLTVTAYPYATVWGKIEIPDDVPEENFEEYVEDHFEEIEFGEPELDFAGSEIEVSE